MSILKVNQPELEGLIRKGLYQLDRFKEELYQAEERLIVTVPDLYSKWKAWGKELETERTFVRTMAVDLDPPRSVEEIIAKSKLILVRKASWNEDKLRELARKYHISQDELDLCKEQSHYYQIRS